ncbi:MAG: HAMP domain-containing histidine kinase [Lachnospiraceae bacterium]|nr:HAMP domain-containing histidine kinase [Lachnospiraceae bacterium]
MIGRLRIKFIITAMMTLLFAVTLVIVVVSGYMGYRIHRQYDILINVIIESEGNLPDGWDEMDESEQGELMVIPEILYETRYFSVLLDDRGHPKEYSLSFIHSVDEDVAWDLASEALNKAKESGAISRKGSYYIYKMKKLQDGELLMVFVDATGRIWVLEEFLKYNTMTGFIILILYFFLYNWYSKEITKPYAESRIKQKQFITNASHELKTPLAVISANMEMMEAVSGENKWTKSTLRQVERLNGLVQELVTLSRLDENQKAALVKIDLSQIAEEEAESYIDVAQSAGLTFEYDAEPEIFVKGEEKSLRQLETILLDNAIKYCDEGGKISLKLGSGKRHLAYLSVSNSYIKGGEEDYNHYFDRFYRADESHNSKKKGFGIGLSIAQEIVRILGGRMRVFWKDGVITFSVFLKRMD